MVSTVFKFLKNRKNLQQIIILSKFDQDCISNPSRREVYYIMARICIQLQTQYSYRKIGITPLMEEQPQGFTPTNDTVESN